MARGYHGPHARRPKAVPRKKTGAEPDPAARVLRRFRLVFNAVKSHFRAVEKKAGVAGAQLWALSVVRDRPGIGVGELARAMDVHQSTASNLVKSLVECQTRRCAQGRCRPAISPALRAPGRPPRVAPAPGPFAGVLPEALASLDARTLARLDRDLGTLIAALDADKRGRASRSVNPSSSHPRAADQFT